MNSKNQSIKTSVILTIIIILGVLTFIFVLINNTKRESEFIISNNSFEVKGMYGETYYFDQITKIELKETIPVVTKKIDGAGLGEIKKGDFELEDWGLCRLYIHANQGPYIVIMSSEKYLVINLYNTEDTTKLYNDLLNNWQK